MIVPPHREKGVVQSSTGTNTVWSSSFGCGFGFLKKNWKIIRSSDRPPGPYCLRNADLNDVFNMLWGDLAVCLCKISSMGAGSMWIHAALCHFFGNRLAAEEGWARKSGPHKHYFGRKSARRSRGFNLHSSSHGMYHNIIFWSCEHLRSFPEGN